MACRVLLPDNVRPVHYDLSLTPDLDNFVFSGSETVTLEVKKASKEIVLNAKELEIQRAEVVLNNGTRHTATVQLDPTHDVCRLSLPVQIEPQTAQLCLDFTGTLNDLLAGFYRSSYVKPDGSKSWMATTQFEPCDARRAFPCWDEPALKATFTVSLTVPAHYVALSNQLPSKQKDLPDGRKCVTFEPTPKMSTYLLAFVCGEFDYVEAHTAEGVRVRTYTPLGLAEQGQLSLDVACRVLSFYGSYFAIPYPLPKLDQVAIPDFSAGAMENWGLVTYRTVGLLFDPKSTPSSIKQRVAYVVAHELAHQWFGNLVTMDWWTHLWLNEGFATWMGWFAIDNIYPEWKVWEQFVANDMKRAFELDCLVSSHPIEVEVRDARQVDEIFDAISYSKGACVIRMIATYLGKESFKAGLQHYLAEHMYRNAATDDLWSCLSKASGTDVKALMDSWTQQTGYPVVHVQEEGGTLQLKQQRFFGTGKREDSTKWIVPLRMGAPDCAPSQDTMSAANDQSPVPVKESTWLKANMDQTGFFRVNYTPALLARLSPAIATGQLEATDRAGVLSDAVCLAQAGYSSITQALTLLQCYGSEPSYTVWSEIVSFLHKMSSVWYKEPEDTQERLDVLLRRLARPTLDRLGWDVSEGESHTDRLLRAMLISACGHAKDPETLKTAREKYSMFMKGGDTSAIHPDLRAAVFSVVLASSPDTHVYDELVKLYLDTESADLKSILLRVIGCGPTADAVGKALDFALSGQVRSQDLLFVISACGANTKGRDVSWTFVKTHWTELCDRLVGSKNLLARIMAGVTSGFVSEERAVEVEKFFAENPMASLERTIQQSVETIRAQAAWLARDRDSVAQWLTTNVALP